MITNRLLLATTLFTALFFSSGQLLADHHESNQKPAHHASDKGEADDADGHGRMMKELNLTKDQRETFKSAMKQMRESMHSNREMHKQLHELNHSSTFDEKKIRELVRKHNTDSEENIVKSSKAMNAFYNSLNPEQKKKLDTMREQRKGEMKNRMKDRKDDHMGKRCMHDDSEADDI